MKTKSEISSFPQITEIDLENIMSEFDMVIPSEREGVKWVKALEYLLARLHMEFKKMFEYAAGKPELLKECHTMRLEMEATKHSIALQRMAYACRN